jgi:putative transposase
VKGLAPQVGLVKACEALWVPRSSFYRTAKPAARPPASARPGKPSPRALSLAEKGSVFSLLNSDRFQDQAPREVYATLLDEGLYVCHWRSMYRFLAENQQIRERRNVLVHLTAIKPELVGTQPNQLWSWDITKVLGPTKRTCYYLYVILDVYSRYVPGWLLAECESAELARELVLQTCEKQNIGLGQLTLHADNGGAMTSKSLALLLADLGVAKTHSRPHVSNDNPYAEAHFKTLKYRPDYPSYFGSLADARAWAQAFFQWYNHEHKHSALGLLTPAMVHHRQAETILAARTAVLQRAYAAHPERFVKGRPSAATLPREVWINRPHPLLELPSGDLH